MTASMGEFNLSGVATSKGKAQSRGRGGDKNKGCVDVGHSFDKMVEIHSNLPHHTLTRPPGNFLGNTMS